MDWAMIGAIGEVLGAAGVILTLGYLARQIRTSYRLERRQSGEAAMDRTANFLGLIAADPDLARIWFQGIHDVEGRSIEDQVRFSALILDLTYIWERVHYLDADGGIDPGLVTTMERGRAEIACSPGYRRWWAIRKHWFSDEFRRVVDGTIEQRAGTYLPVGIAPEGPQAGAGAA